MGGRKAYKRLSFPSDSVINNNVSTVFTAFSQISYFRIKDTVHRDGSGLKVAFLLKHEAGGFLENSTCPPSYESLFKI